MKKIIFYILIFIPLLCYSQNDVTVSDGGGNPVLSGVTAADTGRWGQAAGSGIAFYDSSETDSMYISVQSLSRDSIFKIVADVTDDVDPNARITLSGESQETYINMSQSSIAFVPRGEAFHRFTISNSLIYYHEGADSIAVFQNGFIRFKDSTSVETDFSVTGDMYWTNKTLTDTFALIIYDNNRIDTAALVAAAGWQLVKVNNPFILDFINTQIKGELPLSIKENGKEVKKYRILKPYTASDMQILGEVERLYKRVFINRMIIIVLILILGVNKYRKLKNEK